MDILSILQIVASFLISFAAGFNIWLSRRLVRQWNELKQAREEFKKETDETVTKFVQDFAPAVAFCKFVSEMPGAPEQLKQLAKNSIPDGVQIEFFKQAAGSQHVH
jgi:hypothetical protein